jgi:ketosteroid isomerase-like protein
LGPKHTRAKDGGARKGIEAARRSFIAAMRRGDVAALVAHYDEEAIVVPQTSGVCRGRASIKKLFTRWLSSARVRKFEAKTEDLRILEDSAFEVGTYRILLGDTGSGPVRDEGKFLIVYEQKPDGSWLISRDMSSSNTR